MRAQNAAPTVLRLSADGCTERHLRVRVRAPVLERISEMASMVGYGTFLLEHVVFGMTLGVLALVTAPRAVRRSSNDRELASTSA